MILLPKMFYSMQIITSVIPNVLVLMVRPAEARNHRKVQKAIAVNHQKHTNDNGWHFHGLCLQIIHMQTTLSMSHILVRAREMMQNLLKQEFYDAIVL